MNKFSVYKQYWTGWDNAFLEKDFLYIERDGSLVFGAEHRRKKFSLFKAVYYMIKFGGSGIQFN